MSRASEASLSSAEDGFLVALDNCCLMTWKDLRNLGLDGAARSATVGGSAGFVGGCVAMKSINLLVLAIRSRVS